MGGFGYGPLNEVSNVKQWKWYLRQLLPLVYTTRYRQDGEEHFAVWRMWFGGCYAIQDVRIKP